MTKTILVVEDDEEVRRVAVFYCKELGYRVLEAQDGPAALAQLDMGVHVDLLFTDVIMPNGMNGPELVKIAQGHHPGLKVLFVSGYGDQFSGKRGADFGDFNVMRKPFTIDALKREIRNALENGKD